MWERGAVNWHLWPGWHLEGQAAGGECGTVLSPPGSTLPFAHWCPWLMSPGEAVPTGKAGPKA